MIGNLIALLRDARTHVTDAALGKRIDAALRDFDAHKQNVAKLLDKATTAADALAGARENQAHIAARKGYASDASIKRTEKAEAAHEAAMVKLRAATVGII